MTWICISMSDPIRTRKLLLFCQLFESTARRYISIIFDAMDPLKCPIPFIQKDQGFCENKNRLHSQVASFIVHGKGTYGIVWDEQISKDGNFWAGNLIEVIREIKETHYKDKKFPEVLYMQADNASDNKNLAMYAVCEVLRDLGIFRKVKYSFLPVGHTHEDVDASFGCLSRALRNKKIDGEGTADTLTLEALESVWKTSWGLTKLLFVKVNLRVVQF